MPRIEDIGVFNAVRETGLAKLMPAVPRIAIGMGTCGRGNGAEGLYHAFVEVIERSGTDFYLTSVGCFGACYQEPLVNVRVPGSPLLILHRVQANDAGRIVHDIATGTINPELVYCKIEEWDHITGSVRYGHGYPEVPLWSEVPFFKGQKKIVLRNCGLINPDDIEEYIAVGGYQALYKTLIDDKPESVIEQIKASKLRGRGGAGFLAGNKWEFLRKAVSDQKFIICNADEGDPGAYMNRNEIESDPHSLLEGHDHRRLRDGRQPGHRLCARRISPRRASLESRHRAGPRVRPARQQHPEPGIQLRHSAGGRRGSVCVRRRDRADRVAGRRSRTSSSAAAVSRAKRSVGQAQQH